MESSKAPREGTQQGCNIQRKYYREKYNMKNTVKMLLFEGGAAAKQI